MALLEGVRHARVLLRVRSSCHISAGAVGGLTRRMRNMGGLACISERGSALSLCMCVYALFVCVCELRMCVCLAREFVAPSICL